MTPTPQNTDMTPPVTFELLTPTLTALTPTSAALGDTITVFGKDFIDATHGTLGLFMDGTFTDSNGNESRWSTGQTTLIPLTYVSPGVATFVFGPDIFFSPDGQTLGSFQGTFNVASTLTTPAVNGQPGDMVPSNGIAAGMSVAPSIFIDQLRSVDAPCNPVTVATTGSQNLGLGLHVIGMDDASTGDPITFNVIFDSATVSAAYLANTPYSAWPFIGVNAPNASATAATGTSSFSIPITTGNQVLIDPQHYEQVVTVSPPVMINQQTVSLAKLGVFGTQAVATPGANTMNITVQASRQSGSTISRTIVLPVWNQIELQQWAGHEKVVQIYDPEAANMGCTSGGLLGANIQYTEGTSETKTRSVSMNWNIMNTTSLGLQEGYTFGENAGIAAGPVTVGVSSMLNLTATQQLTWAQTFGIDNSWSVSSENHQGTTISVQVPPNFVAMSYRQATRSERKTQVIYHGACGVSGPVGDAVLTNWGWGYDVAQGPTCPPVTKLSSYVCGGGAGAADCVDNNQ